MPAAVEGTTLTALKEEPGRDKKVKTMMLVRRKSFIHALDPLPRVCVLIGMIQIK